MRGRLLSLFELSLLLSKSFYMWSLIIIISMSPIFVIVHLPCLESEEEAQVVSICLPLELCSLVYQHGHKSEPEVRMQYQPLCLDNCCVLQLEWCRCVLISQFHIFEV